LKNGLRHGYTTGACATAAARGAALMLREQRRIDAVEIVLPTGASARFDLYGQTFSELSSSCFVVKDAGDDPDITNGAEIHATIAVDSPGVQQIVLQGGVGVGRVTKPGLAVSVGEAAINPVPRQMILDSVQNVLGLRSIPAAYTVTISIPNGAELAKKTLNERLGIVGGISILGTTGIVKPISTKAWTDTLDCCIDVALATGAETVILSTGRTSELAVQKHIRLWALGSGLWENLPEEAFIMMGDHVGYSLAACKTKGVKRVILAGQFAKLLKIACGHAQTHVSSSELDLQELAAWCPLEPRTGHLEPLARTANTARQVLEESGNDPALIQLVCEKAKASASLLAPGLPVEVMLVGYNSNVLYATTKP
jgi:cobalt-precorrin-5B (C1)-methyltransferase